jgi:cellobiose transport system substrate-binding protein
MPGGGSNWGGSWLGVPTASKHQAAAIALVEWLSSKDNQVKMWTDGGHWPSNQEAAADPAVSGATSAYFSNAPVGQIYGQIAGQMKIPPIGFYDTQIQNAITTQLTNIETKGTSPDSAWKAALDAIKQVTG